MTDLPTREQFAAMYLVDCDYDNEALAAYSAALTRIEELGAKRELAVEDYWRQYHEAVAAEARATIAEQEVVRLEKALEKLSNVGPVDIWANIDPANHGLIHDD